MNCEDTPHTDAQHDRAADPRDLLQRIAAAGHEAAWIGPAALALTTDSPLAAGRRPVLVVRAPPADRPTIRAQLDTDEAPQLRWIAPSATSWAEALAELAAKEPLPAWGLAVTADGETIDPDEALHDVMRGRLTLRRDPRTWLRGRVSNALKVAVWAAETGLRPGRSVVRAASREAQHVLALPRRLWNERFAQVLVAPHAGTGLQFLYDARILPFMVPEACAMVDFHRSCPVHHKDIWDHTLKVIEKCPPNLAVRWTALMHDTGKVWTRTVTPRGKVRFIGHEELGSSLMQGVAARFDMPDTLRDRVVYIIANHARANVYSTEWTDTAVRRVIRDMGEHLDDVLAFSSSDYTTKRPARIAEVRRLAAELRARIARVRRADARERALPKGLGTTILERTGRPAGKWLGDIQRWLKDEVEGGRLDDQPTIDSCIAHVEAHAPELLIDPR